ncbi:MAG: SDR family oxidoreductase [Bacteroidia bacterium]|nr:SDR family oxidoreductase [Bacteroidia bacterium]
MKGKTVVITGATSGIGRATALGLARMGARVIFNSRDAGRGEAARQSLIQASGNPDLHVFPCDLGSLDAVRQFAAAVAGQFPSVDVLINNAGVWEPSRRMSADGFEYTLAVNHLSHFLLTGLLLEPLKAAGHARVVNVSSDIHPRGSLDFSDLQLAQRYDGIQAYANSKLMNILFTRLLAEKYRDAGIVSNALHPGFVSTDIARSSNWFIRLFFKLTAISTEKGAETSLYLASAPEAGGISGEYFARKAVARSARRSSNMEDARKLWAQSEIWCGFRY